jgi:hypothetical protein
MSAPDLFTAADQRTGSTLRPPSTKRGRRIAFNIYEGEDVRTIVPPGRVGWALAELIAAGRVGITSMENPAPRLAAYIHKAKHVFGVAIESITEMHDGPYPEKHARYRLLSRVEFADPAAAPNGGSDQ